MADNDTNDSLKAHQSKAGKIGGRSRSIAKIMAARANLAKVRARRHNPVTGPQPVQPAQLPPPNLSVDDE